MLLIGDVHGKHDQYLKIINAHHESIQLGDFGFDYNCCRPNHMILGGNHDNYDLLLSHPNNLGDYGTYRNIFFIRGAQSIDRAARIEGQSWWRNEELSYTQLSQCIDLYSKVKPKIVISHTCPKFLMTHLGGRADWGSRTEIAMAQMYNIHSPQMWIFGHFHRSKLIMIGITKFICLNELEPFQLPL